MRGIKRNSERVTRLRHVASVLLIQSIEIQRIESNTNLKQLGSFTVKTLQTPENWEKFTVTMADAHQKYRFSAISIKKTVADRFREFSRGVSQTHTETLEAMLNFFKWNQLSPHDDLGVREDGTKKRINALISIVKSIERDGILPTKAMMEMLFELRPDSNELEEKGKLSMSESEQAKLDLTLELLQEREQRIDLEEELHRTKTALQDLLFHRTKLVRTTLGPNRLQVEMHPKEFESLKEQFNTEESCTSP